MRRNKMRAKRLPVAAMNAMRLGAIVVMAAVMSIVGMLADSSCDQLMKTIGEKERQLNSLEEMRQRESARWEEMKTPERLEVVLRQHGLAMRYPKPEQVVRMRSDGRPYPGQLSVAKARQRNGFSAAQTRQGDGKLLIR